MIRAITKGSNNKINESIVNGLIILTFIVGMISICSLMNWAANTFMNKIITMLIV